MIVNGKVFDKQIQREDGYWLILQDWSSCSLQCGGGSQTRQRICVPPLTAQGRPCYGEALETRPCNAFPCGDTVEVFGGQETRPLEIVTFERNNERPEREETCILKEGDLSLEIERENEKVYQPVRAVMNNATLSLFSDADERFYGNNL